jgi:hypothetical protein
MVLGENGNAVSLGYPKPFAQDTRHRCHLPQVLGVTDLPVAEHDVGLVGQGR